MLQVGYVGSQSYHTNLTMDSNVAPPEVCQNPQGCRSGGVLNGASPVQFACPKEPLDDAPNRFGIQILAANFPGSAGSRLFTVQQACLDQPFDRTVTHAAYPSSLAQADSIRIR